jgi:putative transcriptional regulator
MASALAPGFLIAAPHLMDPNFRQTVVLLLQEGDEGAMGLVVNRESPLLLRELCRDQNIEYRGRSGKRVRSGGPVQPEQGILLYGPEHEGLDGHAVTDGLHVSASTEALERLCDLSDGRFECYAGYAGWGPGQLEREIREGSWILAPADPFLVLDAACAEMWTRALEGLGIDPALLVPGGTEEA